MGVSCSYRCRSVRTSVSVRKLCMLVHISVGQYICMECRSVRMLVRTCIRVEVSSCQCRSLHTSARKCILV